MSILTQRHCSPRLRSVCAARWPVSLASPLHQRGRARRMDNPFGKHSHQTQLFFQWSAVHDLATNTLTDADPLSSLPALASFYHPRYARGSSPRRAKFGKSPVLASARRFSTSRPRRRDPQPPYRQGAGLPTAPSKQQPPDARSGRTKQDYEEFRSKEDEHWRRARQRRFWVTAVTGTVIFGGYYVSHLEEVPMTGRRRFLMVTQRQEETMAKLSYQAVMSQYSHKLLSPSHPLSQMIRKVAKNLIKASGMQDFNWEVNVVDVPTRNAFVLPGGKIFVFTGILSVCENEDGVAAVLGHEIGHQLARHSAEKLSFMKVLLVLQLMLSVVVDTSYLFNHLFLDIGVNLPFSRKCEVEADRIGLLLMAQACYDPRAAIAVWHRMSRVDKQQPLQYLSTHPGHETRIQNIQKWLPEAEKKREESNCHQEMHDLVDMLQRSRIARW